MVNAGEPGDIVECRSDSTYAERPVAFTWDGSSLAVSEIIQRWRSPGIRGFRVRTPYSGAFELLYDEHNDTWSIREL
jgi:hypothetical protein